jgi:hypothetical protein
VAPPRDIGPNTVGLKKEPEDGHGPNYTSIARWRLHATAAAATCWLGAKMKPLWGYSWMLVAKGAQTPARFQLIKTLQVQGCGHIEN